MRFHLPSLDNFSFWIGFIISTIFWWLGSIIVPHLRHLISNQQTTASEKNGKEKYPQHVADKYRQAIFQLTQGMHLAASLFPIDEIAQIPRFMVPPLRVEPGTPYREDSIFESSLPYMQSWPEIAAIYQMPTIELSEALMSGVDIVITGHPGMGKSFTLAYIASRLALRDHSYDFLSSYTPIILHIADLDLPGDMNDPVKSLIDKVAEAVPFSDISGLRDYLRENFSDERILLLLDGIDELPDLDANSVIDFLRKVKINSPNTRIITTASLDFLGNLLSLNFVPLALAAWSAEQRQVFLNDWSRLWNALISSGDKNLEEHYVDPNLIYGWLSNGNSYLTPLELTLKAWCAFSGNVCGMDIKSILRAHSRRMIPDEESRHLIEFLSARVALECRPIFDNKNLKEWLREYDNIRQETGASQKENEVLSSHGNENREKLPLSTKLSSFIDCGLILQDRNLQYRFLHPVFNYFLASKNISKDILQQISKQPFWIGKILTLQFYCDTENSSELITELLSKPDKPLHLQLLNISRWLRDAPRNIGWCQFVTNSLQSLLFQENQPLILRCQALVALLIHDSSTNAEINLLRRMSESGSPSQEQLACFGYGILKEHTSVDVLMKFARNPATNIRRSACLALSIIGNQRAIDALAEMLLGGDENQRRTAAEALALNKSIGHDLLKEGAVFPGDILVRRATAYGLGQVDHEEWADKLLEKIHRDDDQWIVRTAANDMISYNKEKRSIRIPKPLPSPTESPWIIAFAGKQGIGVSPNKAPIDLLLIALQSGAIEEKLASVPYLCSTHDERIFRPLYHALYTGDMELQNTIYLCLLDMASCGIHLPDPALYHL